MLPRRDFYASLDDVRRIVNDALRQEEREDSNGQIDEEDPVPTEIICHPTAERWTNGGRDKDGHAIDGEAHAALLGLEGVSQNRLFGWLQTTAARALHHTEEDQHRQARGESAEHGAARKEEHAEHVKTLAAHRVLSQPLMGSMTALETR